MSNANENGKQKQYSDSNNGMKKKNKKGRALTLSELLIGKQVIPQVYEKQAKRPMNDPRDQSHETENSKDSGHGEKNKKKIMAGTEQYKENETLRTTANSRTRSRSPPFISRANGDDNWNIPKHTNDFRSARAGNNININNTTSNSSWRCSESHSNTNVNENWNIAKDRRQTSNYSKDYSSRANSNNGNSGYSRPLYGSGFSNRPWQQQQRNTAHPPCPPSQYRPLSNNWDDDDRNYRL
ncbi:uncharacterized protein LOC131858280 [Cryptomeria japonica]|uniref:uncharacterized protein LOC131858280 n=1 Tax=Cryptomeria japonica TaxID=3369 RepID=UPI0027DA58A3|nr:uncharacterized protein LOC131858280 [Cryptomeria japonica]